MAERQGRGRRRRGPSEQELIELLRTKAQRYMNLPGVTSVGVGHKQTRNPETGEEEKTGELCIQFTVAKKLSLEALEVANLTPLPASITADDGSEIPIDVIERSYNPAFEIVSDPLSEAAQLEQTPRQKRRSRLDPIEPGISVCHHLGTAGTIGGIVYDNETGSPLILSNWHVLHGPRGRIGDDVVQPGPFDDSAVQNNRVGQLVRSHLGLAGDAAVASIEARNFVENILELDVTPLRAAKVNLGDSVVKSGRTTGVTHGIVERVGVVVNLDYGGTVGTQQIGGFEIRPNPDQLPENGEISMGGDSGSFWLIDDNENSDVVVGLHFAGETDPRPEAEHALACNIHSVLDKLQVSLMDTRSPVVEEESLWNEVFTRLSQIETRLAMVKQRTTRSADPGERSLAARTAASEAIPVYGNWCGPGHGLGEPVDDVDRACMRHAQCYGQRGDFDCECDANLVRALDQALASGDVRALGRVMGPAIRAWFTAQPCVNRVGGMPIPGGTGGTTNAISGGVTGVKKAGRSLWRRVRSAV